MVTTVTYDEDGARNFEGEGVCGGAKFFGSALLQPARSASPLSAFFHSVENPCILHPLTGFPLELDIGAWSQKARMMGLPDNRKSFKMGLAI